MSRGEPDELAEGAASASVSELRTFLIADIRGYTTFTQQRGDEAAAKLTAKFAMVVREVVGEFDGTVLELRGDEALCVFASPRQSVRSSIALQRRFVDETVEDGELPMPVGIGIDIGEAVRGEDGYRGGALNLAARLCSRAKAGEILASEAVSHLARTISGSRYVALEPIQVKGLSESVRPVRVVPDGEDPVRQMAGLLAAAKPGAASGPRVRWLPGPLAAHPRLTAAGVVVAVLVVAGGVVVAVSGGGSKKALVAFDENSVGIVDGRKGTLIAQAGVDNGPNAAASGFDSVWT
ncbi:MAG TPA: adenylate/guanylate cyclase domain-containing protein, partial [Jatrophihabitantaceae bacterium]|nr:adenylate/guanylate cyclase domain-containing protein [Jatrophihabitantaceae bacterium]